MKTDKTKDVWVDISELPKDMANRVSWKQSIGMCVPFKYEYIDGEFQILNYQKEKHELTIKYKEQPIKKINTDVFLSCNFKKYIGYIKQKDLNWAYEINTHLFDKNRSIILINRTVLQTNDGNRKHYKYKCLNCGFDCGSSYFKGKYIEEYWVDERNLKRGIGCACCKGMIVVPGINDIPTTAPWMVDYFQDGYEEAKMYTKTSHQSIYPKCPDCMRIKDKQIQINVLNKMHSCGCVCGDGVSYPNKFIYSMMEQLPIQNLQREYNPLWIKPYLYDIYFEYKNKKYIVEMDGGLGHGNVKYKSHEKDIEGLKRDKIKDQLAKEHNIQVIRIDAKQSELEYIKKNIINSRLNKIFELNQIDWDKCQKDAIKNLVKEVCIYWEKHDHPKYIELYNIFGLCSETINKYLNTGRQYGWCNYNGDNRSLKAKTIKVFDSQYNYLGTFIGIRKFVKFAEENWNIRFTPSLISAVCNGKYTNHKGYIFEWADD